MNNRNAQLTFRFSQFPEEVKKFSPHSARFLDISRHKFARSTSQCQPASSGSEMPPPLSRLARNVIILCRGTTTVTLTAIVLFICWLCSWHRIASFLAAVLLSPCRWVGLTCCGGAREKLKIYKPFSAPDFFRENKLSSVFREALG